jgi:hypothetical protein
MEDVKHTPTHVDCPKCEEIRDHSKIFSNEDPTDPLVACVAPAPPKDGRHWAQKTSGWFGNMRRQEKIKRLKVAGNVRYYGHPPAREDYVRQIEPHTPGHVDCFPCKLAALESAMTLWPPRDPTRGSAVVHEPPPQVNERKKLYGCEDIAAELRRVVDQQATKAEAAKALEISPQYLQGMLDGTRRIPERVWGKLGFRKIPDAWERRQ